ncbi:MAG TPA: BamA/TamA family outer membrane protein, partial [Chitinophagaceae bacterium]|nr:BamA/TamA family outer membrane protein [Chitinophagaceae bacterium]
NRNYYRMRSREIHGWIGLSRGIGKKFYIEWGPLFQQVKLIEDPERYLSKGEVHSSNVYEAVNYGGVKLHARLDTRDDQVVATRGWVITADADYVRNLDEPGKDVSHYRLGVQTYIPLFTPHLVAHLRTGGAMMNGDAAFYQYNSIGGSQVLRGYPRDRFRGNTTFYSSNELQYLFNVRSGIFNGKMGILGLYDIGRVWLDGEDSDEWHWGYGGGLMLAPFNKVSVSVYYGFSPEGRQFHLRYSKKL